MTKRLLGTVRFGLLAMFLSVGAVAAQAAVIADWRFEQGAFLTDSGPYGYNLTNNGGVAQNTSDTVNGSSNGSAQFTNNFLSTPTLSLSGYRQIELSWSMKLSSASATSGIIFETTSNFNLNPGAIIADVFENNPCTNCGEAGVNVVGGAQWHLDAFPHDPGTTPVWEDYRMIISLDAAVNADIVQVYRNGVLQPDVAAYGLHNATGSINFLDAIGNIGRRSGGGGNYQGLLDNIKLQTVPEPGTALLLGCGALTMVAAAVARRRREV